LSYGCSATANLSASGSLASIIRLQLFSAVSIANFNALLPSSGFGNGTVGNSGFGSFCCSTTITG